MKKNLFLKVLGSILICFLFSSCISVGLNGFMNWTDENGQINVDKIEAVSSGLSSSVSSLSKIVEGITPENEYYIGRSVAASILEKYSIIDNKKATEYVNKIASTLNVYSDKPYLYKGYFVAILDSPEINAISTPGGHIFITKGLIECTKSEDALASVIAHELSHIQLGHSTEMITGDRGIQLLSSSISTVLAAGGSNISSKDVDAFNDTCNNVVGNLMKTGFSQSQEFEADNNALILMARAGYNPYALLDMLEEIEKNGHKGSGWFETHPAPNIRIREAQGTLNRGNFKTVSTEPRTKRFNDFKKSLL